jgi:GNAT superfamily N-acetyltransferase
MRFQNLINATGLPEEIEPSRLESQRFGLSVGRLALGATASLPEAGAIKQRILSSDFDLVILRYPAQWSTTFADLRDPQLELIFADTLIYYQRSLESPPQPKAGLAKNLTIRRAGLEDSGASDRLVSTIFRTYTNHYSANARLSQQNIASAYAEWARAYLTGDHGCYLMAEKGPRDPVGLVTLDLGLTAEVALIGVLPSEQRQGIAAALMEAAEDYAARQGSTLLVISTQVQNLAVQRLWIRCGYLPTLALNTVHVSRRR